MKRNLKLCMLVAAMTFPVSAATAHADDTQIIDFFAGEGCAIGPTTRALAIEAGFEEEAIEALAQTARADPESVETGDWVVLSAASCKIRPPRVKSELRLDDPEIKSRISAIDLHADEGEPGCFLNADTLYEELMVTRGWLPDKALREHLRLLSENLVTGELAFYTDDSLSTPVGFQLTSGECADVPNMAEIRRSHQVLIENFDRLIRADMENAVCETDGSPSWQALQLFPELTGGESSNAWMAMEMRFILMGSGWIEGITMTNKGMPRPPLCTYE
ncbi:hypothetical protein [Mesorhizobium sp. CAU 1732]|uniref:hypothetical protein n=1 Tax=Mesorhizobium sp. CAU 1732 TaxID=3140358 RepID=UPI0032608A49